MATRFHRILNSGAESSGVPREGEAPAEPGSAGVLPSWSGSVGVLSSKSAFTLVELLIVIAILALLVSILVPGLQSARAQAKAGVCGSNLRQLALANELYANDREHRYCPGAANIMTKNLHRWHGTREHPSQPFTGHGGPLLTYLGLDGKIRACPAWHSELPEGDARGFEKNCGGYGYNLAFVGRQLEKLPSDSCSVVTDLLGTQRDRIRRPAETIMFADTAFVSGELIEYSFAEPRFFPTWGSRPDPSIHFRHHGKANVVWCDGHVDARLMNFTWTSGFYPGQPHEHHVGWFGEQDDNTYFDLE